MGWYHTQFGFCFLVPTAYGGLLWVKTVRKTGGKNKMEVIVNVRREKRTSSYRRSN